jgi:hypothetical protein
LHHVVIVYGELNLIKTVACFSGSTGWRQTSEKIKPGEKVKRKRHRVSFPGRVPALVGELNCLYVGCRLALRTVLNILNKAETLMLIKPLNFSLHARFHPPFMDFQKPDSATGIKKPPHFEECGGDPQRCKMC